MRSSPDTKRGWSADPWLVLLLLVAAVLLLAGLGNGRLWQDEAETAVLAKNILRFGYPRAFDGVNRLNPGLPLGPNYAWTYHPWGSLYTAALSFLLFGINTASARLPFALMGLFSIWMSYRVVRRITGDRSLARWTAFLLATSVPFLLHMRQCRYYAPSVLFSLWAAGAYGRFLRERRWAGAELVFALLLLFHNNHGVFLPTVIGLALHLAWIRPGRKTILRAAGVGAVTAALTLPFFLFLQSGQHHTGTSFKELRHHAEFYFRQINIYLLPVTVWILPLIVWRSSFRPVLGRPGSPLRAGWKLAVCLLAAGLVFLVFVPYQRHFRYLIYLIPWLLMAQAALLRRVVQLRRPLGLALAAILIFTNLNYAAPYALAKSEKGRVRSYQWELIEELLHPYRGPIDGIVELLDREGKPGETLKTPYEEYPILFYTSLRVEPLARMEDFANETFPDWIVLRRDWLPGGFLESDYFRRIQASYREILLDAPDIPWQNRPDPGYHRFRTDSSAPPVRVFRKLGSLPKPRAAALDSNASSARSEEEGVS